MAEEEDPTFDEAGEVSSDHSQVSGNGEADQAVDGEDGTEANGQDDNPALLAAVHLLRAGEANYDFTAGKLTVRNLLAQRQRRFVNPYFQRPYSWTERQVQTLLQNLLSAFQESNPNEYNLGPVSIAEADAQALLYILDGQQRITTLLLILSAARCKILEFQNHIPAYPAAMLALFAAQMTFINECILTDGSPTDDDGNTEQHPRLISDVDDDFLHRILGPEIILDQLDVDGALTESELHMRRNLRTIRRFFDKNLGTPGIFIRFLTYLRERSIVNRTLYSNCRPSVMRMQFMAINSTGLPLTRQDFVKVALFGAIEQAHKDELPNLQLRWNILQARLGAYKRAYVSAHGIDISGFERTFDIIREVMAPLDTLNGKHSNTTLEWIEAKAAESNTELAFHFIRDTIEFGQAFLHVLSCSFDQVSGLGETMVPLSDRVELTLLLRVLVAAPEKYNCWQSLAVKLIQGWPEHALSSMKILLRFIVAASIANLKKNYFCFRIMRAIKRLLGPEAIASPQQAITETLMEPFGERRNPCLEPAFRRSFALPKDSELLTFILYCVEYAERNAQPPSPYVLPEDWRVRERDMRKGNEENSTRYFGSLEHIFPQKARSREWSLVPNHYEELQRVLGDIGNICLLESNLNAAGGTFSYPKKCEEYARTKYSWRRNVERHGVRIARRSPDRSQARLPIPAWTKDSVSARSEWIIRTIADLVDPFFPHHAQ